MTKISFEKYHVLGNDYIIIDNITSKHPLSKKNILDLCDRNRGIGADGIIIHNSKDKNNNFNCEFFNSDGSKCGKSGNGISIYSKWIKENFIQEDNILKIKTPSGISNSDISSPDEIGVNLGYISLDSIDIGINIDNVTCSGYNLITSYGELDVTSIYNGNPHTVVFTHIPDNNKKDIATEIIHHPIFKNKTNVEFINFVNEENIYIDVFERGSGYKTASGSGASAAAYACILRNLCKDKVTVKMNGGNMFIVKIKDEIWQFCTPLFCFNGVTSISYDISKDDKKIKNKK